MDYLKCEVRLGGNVQNTVMRRDVTPAEIEVLRAKHGADAIVNIEVTHSDDSDDSPVSLREKLIARYGKVVYELFPGARPNIPVTAEEVGVVEVKAKPKAKAKAEPAIEPEPKAEPKPVAPAPKKTAAVPQTTALLDD